MTRRSLGLVARALLLAVLPYSSAANTNRILAWGSSINGATTVPPGLSNVVAVAAGGSFNLALKPDGTVVRWGGGNIYSQSGLSNVVAVAAGDYQSLVLKADGTVTAWVSPGQLSGSSQVPRGLTNVIAIAGGRSVSLALKADGTVASWGNNVQPPPAGLSNVIAISAGGDGSRLALQSDGTVVGWGINYYGQISIPVGLKAVAIAAGGRHSLALKADGKVVAWGDNLWGQASVPPGLSNVVSIAAGWGHSLALRADGKLIAWGLNGDGQTNVPAAATNVLAIASGSYSSHSLALIGGDGAPFLTAPIVGRTIPIGMTTHFFAAASGALPMSYQWQLAGTNLPAATNVSLTLPNIQASQAGWYSIVVSNAFGAVTSSPAMLATVPLLIVDQPQSRVLWDGATANFLTSAQSGLPVTYRWRFNGTELPGETNSALTRTNLQASNTGVYSATISNALGGVTTDNALLTLGRIATWGSNYAQQVDLPAAMIDVVSVAAGPDRSLALKSDGTVIQWGNTNGLPPMPEGLTNIISLAAGWSHTVALKANGEVVVWGENFVGQTDLPDGLTNVVAIAAGSDHSVALKADGTVETWGYNDNGVMEVPFHLSNVVAVAAREFHTMALTADGHVRVWGEPDDETYDVPADLTNAVAIAAGSRHSLALKSDGTVVGWGSNYYGESDAPSGLSNVVALGAGYAFSLAVRADGTVIAWGDNTFGATNVPPGVNDVVGFAVGNAHAVVLLNPMLPLRLSHWKREAQRFSVVIPTLLRKQYSLEFKNSLDQPAWTNAVTIPGSGFGRMLEDTNANAPQRFYRVRME